MAPTKQPEFTITRPIFGPNFLKEAYAELKRVNWPTRQQTLRLTLIVLGTSLVVGAYIGLLDSTLTKLMEKLLVR